MSTIDTTPSSKCGSEGMAAKPSPWRSRSMWAPGALREALRLTAVCVALGLAVSIVAPVSVQALPLPGS